MLVRLVVRWAGNAVALYVAAWLLSGVTYGDEWWTLLVAAAVFTVVNAWLRPVVRLLSLPLIILTLGLFLFVVNVLMLYVTDWLVAGFEIRSFGAGVLAAIIVSVVNWALHAVIPGPR
jgi:putative membrane protein